MPRINPIQRARAIPSRRGVGLKVPSSTPLGNQILTITSNSGFASVTTAGPHGLVAEDVAVVVSGNSVAGYNKATTTNAIASPTEFLTNIDWTEDGAGGTWVLG